MTFVIRMHATNDRLGTAGDFTVRHRGEIVRYTSKRAARKEARRLNVISKIGHGTASRFEYSVAREDAAAARVRTPGDRWYHIRARWRQRVRAKQVRTVRANLTEFRDTARAISQHTAALASTLENLVDVAAEADDDTLRDALSLDEAAAVLELEVAADV